MAHGSWLFPSEIEVESSSVYDGYVADCFLVNEEVSEDYIVDLPGLNG